MSVKILCPEDFLGIKRRFIPKIIGNIKDVKIKDSIVTCEKCGDSIGSYQKIQKIGKILVKEGNVHLTNIFYLCRNCKGLL